MFDEIIKDTIALYVEIECSSPEIAQKIRQLTVEGFFEFAVENEKLKTKSVTY